MADITLSLSEYQEILERQKQLSEDLAAAQAVNVNAMAGVVDERLMMVADHAIPIVKFAMTHLSPEAVHGWPANDLAFFATMLRDRPVPTADERTWLEDAMAFSRECTEWDRRRESRQRALQHEIRSRDILYMAHPIGRDEETRRTNLRRAERWFRYLVDAHPTNPICVPWYLYVVALNENTDRERGIRDDLAILERCDQIVLVGGRISEGMQREVDRMKELGKLVIDLTHLGQEAPP